jgi:hypothetical protein
LVRELDAQRCAMRSLHTVDYRQIQELNVMLSITSRLLPAGIAVALLAACGGGSGSGSVPMSSAPQSASVPLLVSDASTEDWATIGVKVLSIALVPQGGGSNVNVYTAPSPAPIINLAQLDQVGEILGNASVPVGTYTGAVLTVSGNSNDIILTVSADPETGFAALPGTTISASQIQVQHTTGSGSSLTVPIDVTFASPLVASTTQSNALDLEFDLGHPAFIVEHMPPGAGGTLWAVNFDGPVHHHPLHDLSRLVLRHAYGSVQSIAADFSSITINREFPTIPAVNPETAVTTTQMLQILADAANGTLFYDLDGKTKTVIKDFSAETSLAGKSVRIAARYQENGTLIATRIWASSQFNNVWVSPEGHVLHVDTAGNVVTVASESGRPVAMTVDANTEFFFRTPQNGAADAAPIATGTGFLANHDLVRGFKIHASVVDPLASPLVAQSVDIEAAVYDGQISAPDMTGFTDTRNFRTAADDYVYILDYVASTTPNGTDPAGNAITGYKWWNFAYPTSSLTSGANAITDFVAATDGSVNFGGTVGAVPTRGVSYAIWNDPANTNGWAAAASIVTPSLLPMGLVATGLANNAFTMTVAGGATAATVDVNTTAGSATLAYQVDRTNGIVTISPVDITTAAGLATFTAGLAAGAPVKVYGVPQADATLRAYVLVYFTGEIPAQSN